MYTINAHAKVNIFLKITGHKEGYHTLLSRFMRVDDLYDTITFEPCVCEVFTIEGCEGVALESNTIYKAYQTLVTIHKTLNWRGFSEPIRSSSPNASRARQAWAGGVLMLQHLCASAMRCAYSISRQKPSRNWAAR